MLSSANYNMPYVIDLQNCVFKNNRHIISICNNKNGFKYEYLKSNITEYPHTICIINTEFIIDYNINFNSENNMIVGSCPCQLNSGLIDVDDKSKKNIFFHANIKGISEYPSRSVGVKYPIYTFTFNISVFHINGKLLGTTLFNNGTCGYYSNGCTNGSGYHLCLHKLTLDTIINCFMVINITSCHNIDPNQGSGFGMRQVGTYTSTGIIVIPNKLKFNEDNNHIIYFDSNYDKTFNLNCIRQIKNKIPEIKSESIQVSKIDIPPYCFDNYMKLNTYNIKYNVETTK